MDKVSICWRIHGNFSNLAFFSNIFSILIMFLWHAVSGYSGLLDYLNWRETVFFSSGHDTSLLQMLPCWFPKAVRRLIQLYVQVRKYSFCFPCLDIYIFQYISYFLFLFLDYIILQYFVIVWTLRCTCASSRFISFISLFILIREATITIMSIFLLMYLYYYCIDAHIICLIAGATQLAICGRFIWRTLRVKKFWLFSQCWWSVWHYCPFLGSCYPETYWRRIISFFLRGERRSTPFVIICYTLMLTVTHFYIPRLCLSCSVWYTWQILFALQTRYSHCFIIYDTLEVYTRIEDCENKETLKQELCCTLN